MNPAEVDGVLPIPLVQPIGDHANSVSFFVVLEHGQSVQFIRREIKEPYADLQWLLCRTRFPQLSQVLLEDIRTMMNHESNQLFFQDVEVPAENLIGEEGQGFRYILDGMNAERILIAAECVGDGYWFIERAVRYANERVVFDRPIGKNQGVSFPIAQAYVHVRAADLMRLDAAKRFDASQACGPEAKGLRINKVNISTHEAKLNSSSLHENLLAPS